MTVYLIQASPLTKIFLKEWQERCLAEPALAAESCDFDVTIPRPVGSITLSHMKPVVASTLIPRSMYDEQTKKSHKIKIEEDVVSPLVAWLTEENNSETDIWGVVSVPIETNVADAVMTLVHGKDAQKAAAKLINEIQKKLQADLVDARERADKRVLRHCNKMYNVVLQTVNEIKKAGKGGYQASYTEALALDILKDQIKARRQATEQSQAIFDKALSEVAPQPSL